MYKFFDYKCPKCSTQEERFVKGDVKQKCKECGTEMIKLVSAPGMAKGNFADKAGFKNS